MIQGKITERDNTQPASTLRGSDLLLAYAVPKSGPPTETFPTNKQIHLEETV